MTGKEDDKQPYDIGSPEIGAQSIALPFVRDMILEMQKSDEFSEKSPEEKTALLVGALESFLTDEWKERMTLMFKSE